MVRRSVRRHAVPLSGAACTGLPLRFSLGPVRPSQRDAFRPGPAQAGVPSIGETDAADVSQWSPVHRSASARRKRWTRSPCERQDAAFYEITAYLWRDSSGGLRERQRGDPNVGPGAGALPPLGPCSRQGSSPCAASSVSVCAKAPLFVIGRLSRFPRRSRELAPRLHSALAGWGCRALACAMGSRWGESARSHAVLRASTTLIAARVYPALQGFRRVSVALIDRPLPGAEIKTVDVGSGSSSVSRSERR